MVGQSLSLSLALSLPRKEDMSMDQVGGSRIGARVGELRVFLISVATSGLVSSRLDLSRFATSAIASKLTLFVSCGIVFSVLAMARLIFISVSFGLVSSEVVSVFVPNLVRDVEL